MSASSAQAIRIVSVADIVASVARGRSTRVMIKAIVRPTTMTNRVVTLVTVVGSLART
jgi:hypothetical protein